MAESIGLKCNLRVDEIVILILLCLSEGTPSMRPGRKSGSQLKDILLRVTDGEICLNSIFVLQYKLDQEDKVDR